MRRFIIKKTKTIVTLLDKLLTFFTSENNFYILPFGIYQQLVHPKHDEMILLIPGFSDKKKSFENIRYSQYIHSIIINSLFISAFPFC